MYLFVASSVASTLFNAPANLPSIRLFPDYASVIQLSIGKSTPASAGTEPLALIDAVLALFTFLEAPYSVPDSVQTFNETVQRLALLSANTPNASLRYQAHLVTKTILASHPDKATRLDYIKDTLKNCPYENLKASAVGWLKEEILADSNPESIRGADEEPSVQVSTTLAAIASYLFVDPQTMISEGDFSPFLAHQSYFLAVLNLSYLILSPGVLRTSSGEIIADLKIWLVKIERMACDIREMLEAGKKEGEDVIPGLEMDLALLEGNLELVGGRLQ